MRAAQRPAILDVRERLMHLLARLPEAEPVFVFRAAEEIRDMAVALADAETPEPPAGEAIPLPAPAAKTGRFAPTPMPSSISRALVPGSACSESGERGALINVDRRAELEAAAERTRCPASMRLWTLFRTLVTTSHAMPTCRWPWMS